MGTASSWTLSPTKSRTSSPSRLETSAWSLEEQRWTCGHHDLQGEAPWIVRHCAHQGLPGPRLCYQAQLCLRHWQGQQAVHLAAQGQGCEALHRRGEGQEAWSEGLDCPPPSFSMH